MIVKDDTETCRLMLLGSVATSIVGVEADDLWDGSYAEVFFDIYFLAYHVSAI